jgi:hypothetical protein
MKNLVEQTTIENWKSDRRYEKRLILEELRTLVNTNPSSITLDCYPLANKFNFRIDVGTREWQRFEIYKNFFDEGGFIDAPEGRIWGIEISHCKVVIKVRDAKEFITSNFEV